MSDVAATPFGRRISQLVAVGLLLLLVLQIAQNTIFSGAINAVLGPTSFYRLNVGVYSAILLIAVASPDYRHRLRRFHAVSFLTVAYGAAIVTSTLMNIQPVTETPMLQALLIPLTILSLGVCLPAILDLDGYEVLFRGVIVAFALSAIASLWLVFTQRPTALGQPLQVSSDGRGGRLAASGLYSHRNAIGSFLQYIPALIVYLASRHSTRAPQRRGARLWWWGYLCALPLIFAHMVLTFSRSSQVVAALSLTPLLRGIPHARRRIVYGVGAVFVAGVIMSLATVPEFQHYAGLGGSLRGRPRIWQAIIQRVDERPLFGFGLLSREFRTPTRVDTPHNAYLAQLAYFGIVGCALFLALLVAFGRLVIQNLRSVREAVSLPIVMLVAAVLLQGVVEYILTFPVFFANSMFWICLGLVARGEEEGTKVRKA